MENKKSYYENDSRDMRNFNPRFNDLYQGYSDNQQENHTFNLNGTIYVHNHNGGEPIPLGKAKTLTGGRSTAQPGRRPSQRERKQADLAGVNRPRANAATAQRGNAAGTVRQKAKPPAANRTGAGRIQGEKGAWNQERNNTQIKAVRGLIVGFVVLFSIAMIVPTVASLVSWDNDIDFGEDDGDAYEDSYVEPDIKQRESQPLAEPITEEGIVYLMGGYIGIGQPADTLLESYEKLSFAPQEPIQPGENYYMTLDIGEKYGAGSIVLKNTGNKATKQLSDFTITDVSADYYTEWGEDFESTRTETDCEILGGITIGMDGTDALRALAEVCPDAHLLDPSEENQGHLIGYSERYYYVIRIEDERVSSIDVSLREEE